MEDAEILQKAGCFALVFESIPARLADLISHRIDIPTIGIGAGVHCDGQVLVIHDMLGLFDDFQPKFVKRYADLKKTMSGAVKDYIGEVKEKTFPREEHSCLEEWSNGVLE